MAHDFYADTFDTIDNKHFLWNSRNPDKKYEVVSLLDRSGDETEDTDAAIGGVVKLADECFTCFTFDGANLPKAFTDNL